VVMVGGRGGAGFLVVVLGFGRGGAAVVAAVLVVGSGAGVLDPVTVDFDDPPLPHADSANALATSTAVAAQNRLIPTRGRQVTAATSAIR
jgi:hypothetical protein